MKLEPKEGFDWSHVAWGHPNSPQAFLCSYCSAPIGSTDVPLILSTTAGYVAKFCAACMVKWWGMQ